MNSLLPVLVGATLCFIVPAISFVAGITIGRYGSPVRIEWRGLREHSADDD